MNILTLNAGSATLKYKLFAMPAEDVLEHGSLDHPSGGIVQAAQSAIEACDMHGINAVGHRVVHGGLHFTEPVRISVDVVARLRELRNLDPLHNPTETDMIEAGLRLLPDVPAVAVFDTAFHRTLPEVAWRYALPADVASRLGIRRFGFHGISHQYVSERLIARLGVPAQGTKLIVCHLGNGASICAVRDGKSVDTSMGMTPLEGLVMGTRSGDIDPGLVLYLLRSDGMTPRSVDSLLNYRSGLLGLSGRSADVQVLENAVTLGDAAADIALDIFAYRACKYIGAYAAAMEGLDAIAFTAGIGEHSAGIRRRVCQRLGFLGIYIDDVANDNASAGGEVRISADGERVQVWVIPTDEERQIARVVYEDISH